MSDKRDARESLRVAYFAGSMKPGVDGVTRVLYRLIDALQREGITNTFYSPIIPPPEARPTEMTKVPSIAFPGYKEYRVALPGYRYFERHLDAFRPDLLHVNSPCPLGYAAVRYGQTHGIPVVATYHTHFPSYARYYKLRSLEALSWQYFRKLYNGCERIYVPSMPILRELSGHGIRNLKCLSHGVDTSVFQPAYRSGEWKEKLGAGGRNVLLFAGRLVWEKDLRILAETSTLLSARRHDVVFALAGDGPARHELEQMMPGAIFLGQITGKPLSTAYASSDLLVFPSTTETFGNVVLEAMASGIVPVCARKGGPAGVIEHGVTGLLAEPRDPVDFAEKIESLLDHPEKRREMAEQALRYARQQAWDLKFESMFQDYREVIDEYARQRTPQPNKAA